MWPLCLTKWESVTKWEKFSFKKWKSSLNSHLVEMKLPRPSCLTWKSELSSEPPSCIKLPHALGWGVQLSEGTRSEWNRQVWEEGQQLRREIRWLRSDGWRQQVWILTLLNHVKEKLLPKNKKLENLVWEIEAIKKMFRLKRNENFL